MTLQIEDESDLTINIDYEKIANRVIDAALDFEKCPYEVELNLLITTNNYIQRINKEYRGIDSATDVLSFPMIQYETPSDFSNLENNITDNFNPETGELILGDIIISAERMCEQAENYGHSQEREFAFLVLHSMLHLFGYDHMEPCDANIMETKQKQILDELKIFR